MNSGCGRRLGWTSLLLLIFTGSARTAFAQVHVEIDPIAFALDGFSLHVGQSVRRVRGDAGIFGIDVPKSFEANSGWTTRARGAGLKLDFVSAESDSWFAGIVSNVTHAEHTLQRTSHTVRDTQLTFGPRLGYRWFPSGAASSFYLSPWVSADYAPNARALTVDGATYVPSRWQLFPTVHLGWRF
jgi:hypothetical protein